MTQLVIRIDTTNPNHQFTVTLTNDQGASGANIIPNEDGALGLPGSSSFTSGQVVVSSGSADSNGMDHAFAVYRAPLDFARPTPTGTSFKTASCNGANGTDDQLACRSVSIQVQDTTSNTNLGTTQITLVRPPLILIHGIWGDYTGWENFYPLITGSTNVDSRFYVGRVNWKNQIPSGSPITATSPTLTPAGSMPRILTNSLGFTYNAPHVADQIHDMLAEFKAGGAKTPVGIPVAAVQVDIIGHSMGGPLARQLVLGSGFLDSSTSATNNFGQGYIHKLITIGSPHLGSPLALALVDTANIPVRQFFEHYGYYSLNSVTLAGQPIPVPGAMAELTGNGIVDSQLSSALQKLGMNGPRQIPAALVAGNYTAWSVLGCGGGCTPNRIRTKGPNSPLAKSFTSNYPNNFNAAPTNLNDGIVGVTSQLNGPSSNSWQFAGNQVAVPFAGLAHSHALTGGDILGLGLGFVPPSELDSAKDTPPNPIAQTVVDLLNTPLTMAPFSQNLINP